MSSIKQEKRANILFGISLTAFLGSCIGMITIQNVYTVYVFLATVPITLLIALVYERRIYTGVKQ